MLNACPKCQRTFPADEAGFCPEDASPLAPIDQVPLPRDPSDPVIGHTIAGKYEIRRTIADGGMGRVYEARQLDSGRRIAVKILHAQIAEDPINIERFRREAETSRSLDHQYIIDVYDFDHEASTPGRSDGAWFLVMEYLDGEELRAALDRQNVLPIDRVIRIVAQTAIALDGAHARGVVHRDLKPDNIFLVRRSGGDQVKLLDFGSVKYTKGQDKGQKLTVMGTTIGSPYYMSPEQARGIQDLDHRADVWALGCIVYEMTVGRTPFNGPNGPQILFKILGEEPMPPSFANDAAPAELDDVMVRVLCKDREQRFQSCGEFADALGHAFGLQGSHREWANAPTLHLANRAVSSGAPDISATPPSSPALPFPMAAAPAGPSAGLPTQPVPWASGGVEPPLADDYSPIKTPPVALYIGLAAGLVALLALIVVLALR